MIRRTILAALMGIVALTGCLATPVRNIHERDLLPPSKDEFYTPPKDLDHLAPGSVIKIRETPAPVTALGVDPVNIQASYQILYKTSDAFNASTATVVTVLIPHNARMDKMLSYQMAEDSAALDCAPSYALLQGVGALPTDKLFTPLTKAEFLLVEAALEQGWVVVSPDHEGPQAAFLGNVLAGRATLDGIRAVVNSAHVTKVSTKPSIAMWGYSGGSVATGWAAELHPTYAPELNIVGAVLGGTVPNISSVLTACDQSFFSGLLVAGIAGMANQYPAIADALKNHMQPQYEHLFDAAKTQCLVADITENLFQNIAGRFSPGLFTSPDIMAILNENALGHAAPTVPIFMYKSVLDEISPIKDTDDLVKYYCSSGSSVNYDRDLLSAHGISGIVGIGKSMAWLINALDGTLGQTGCQTQTVITSLFDPSTVKVLPKAVLDALLDLLGKSVGS